MRETRSPTSAAESSTINSAKSAEPDVCVIPFPVVDKRRLPTPLPPESEPEGTPVKYSINRGHVVPVTQDVPYGVLRLSRSTLLPELNVLLLLVTAKTAVPVAPVAAVADPKNETVYVALTIPTPSGPINVEVAVDVEIILPVINLPYAVVEANVALDVAESAPKIPLTDVSAEANNVDEVASVDWMVDAKRYVDVACVVVAFLAVKSWKVEEAETKRFVVVAFVVRRLSAVSADANNVEVVAFVAWKTEEKRLDEVPLMMLRLDDENHPVVVAFIACNVDVNSVVDVA